MLTQKQQDYLETIPDNRVAQIAPFNPDVQKTAHNIISEIESVLPSLKVTYLGSSKLGIAGENDIDLNILSGDDFHAALPILTKLFGEPTKVKMDKKNVRGEFIRDGFPVEIHVADVITPSLQERMDTQKILENDKELLKEYEQLKLQSNGLPWREYQKRKYEFWNKILGL